MTEPRPHSGWRLVLVWVYLVVGSAAIATSAWLRFWSQPANVLSRGRTAPYFARQQQTQRQTKKRPPVPRSTGRTAVLNTWIKQAQREVYYVDLRPFASVRKGEFIWNDAFSSYFHPVGVSVYHGIPFYVHEDGSIIVLPTEQDQSLQSKPSYTNIRFIEPPIGATECWVLGLVAGWGGDISEVHGESAIISFLYEGEDQKDSYKVYSCDIWDHAHQKREVEKDNIKAVTIEGIHLDMRAFQLRSDAHLKSVTIQDPNPISSPLIMAITFIRPLLPGDSDSASKLDPAAVPESGS